MPNTPTLLATKLQIPHRPPERTIARPHLIEKLDEPHLLTILAAPAGYGKTTLASLWATRLQEQLSPNPAIAWVSLDTDDNEPARFAAYLTRALAPFYPALAALSITGEPAASEHWLASVMTWLVNELAANSRPCILILDDFHMITAPPIHRAIAMLLEHPPAAFRLVVLTRTQPPIPLGRLRALDQVNELDPADMRFSAAETAEFLRRVMRLSLSARDIATLEARTEGWAAGLQLAALSLGAQPDLSALIETFTGSDRHIVDYLVEEIVQRQPEPVRRFLLATSILDRICLPLCETLLEEPCGPLLAYVERANLFLRPLDRQRHWYCYHQLFAEALRAHGRDHLRAKDLTELYQRAARWYAAEQLWPEAIRYALATTDYEYAADLIEQVVRSFFARSQTRTIMQWLRALPSQIVHARPMLCVAAAWAYANAGDLTPIGPLLEAVDRTGDQDPLVASEAARVRANVARLRGDVPAALHWGQQALALCHPKNHRDQSVAQLILGHAFLLADRLTDAVAMLAAAIRSSQASGHLAVYLSAIHYQAQVAVLQGQLPVAADLYRQALHEVTRQPEPVSAGIERIGLGELLREWGDLAQATEHLETGVRLAELGGDGVFLRDGYLAQARLSSTLGDHTAALGWIEQAAALCMPGSTEARHVAAWRVRLQLHSDDPATAVHWAATRGPHLTIDGNHLDEFEQLTLVRVWLAQGNGRLAQQRLKELRARAERTQHIGRSIEVDLLNALAWLAQNQPARASSVLERALRRAEPANYLRLFVDEGTAVMRLLAGLHFADERMRAYQRRILAAFQPAAAPGESPPADGLSMREQEILMLLAAGLGNRDIAARLVVSISTVNWHTHNIYSKLGVHSRTQATARAYALGLIPAPPSGHQQTNR